MVDGLDLRDAGSFIWSTSPNKDGVRTEEVGPTGEVNIIAIGVIPITERRLRYKYLGSYQSTDGMYYKCS